MIFDRQYMQLCSEKTLQANKEGFFLQFAECVAVNAGEKWIRHVFGKLKTDKERLKKIYEDDKIKDYVLGFLLNVQEIYRKKCPETALKRRLEAEACLKIGDKKKALNLYSQCILKAPSTDENLALALLGRAKLLMTMREYANSLTDLQLCLKRKIPNRFKYEIFWMMAVCYKALGETNKSTVSLNLAEKLIGSDAKLLKLLHDSLEAKHEPIRKRDMTLPPISGQRHSIFAHASNKIALKKSAELGRYVVANDEIKTGETLVVEPPTAACLLPEKFGTHCHHCFNRLLAPVGCPDCSSVAFCGPSCRDVAVTTYHKYECKFLDLLIGSGMSVLSHTALRMVTQKNCDKIDDLCTNADKRPAGDFLQRTLMAAFLLRCLQKGGYFDRGSDAVVPTEQEYQVGEVLLRNLQMLQFNAHEVYETLYDAEHRLKGGKLSYIGVAVYPTVALFNHDCYPAVTRYFVGKDIVITSSRPLSPGSTIAENYGPIFTCRKLMDRQRALSSRYWFNCRCRSCLEDWPTLNNGSSLVKRVRCPTSQCLCLFTLPIEKDTVECPKCTKTVSLGENIGKLKWCEEQYGVGGKLVEAQKVEEAIAVLREALDVFHRVSAAPHVETHSAEELLTICLAHKGNGSDSLVKAKTD